MDDFVKRGEKAAKQYYMNADLKIKELLRQLPDLPMSKIQYLAKPMSEHAECYMNTSDSDRKEMIYQELSFMIDQFIEAVMCTVHADPPSNIDYPFESLTDGMKALKSFADDVREKYPADDRISYEQLLMQILPISCNITYYHMNS